jgi:N-acetylmuramoyl-L-alanine amidase
MVYHEQKPKQTERQKIKNFIMSELKYLIIHCTATPEGREVTKKNIEQWHLVERGWSKVGYRDMIHLNGGLENLIDYNQDDTIDHWEISNGARGFNGNSAHVVYVGGTKKNDIKKPKDTRTYEQHKSLQIYVLFMILRHPKIRVIGHNEVSKKDCPGFFVGEWLRSICVDESNIGLEK